LSRDWIKGIPYTLVTINLPNGYAINVTVRQHLSGKVCVAQSVSKIVGVMLPNLKFKMFGKDPLDTAMMDKLNEVLHWELEVES